MLSVFIDTLLICSATALMCLCSGVEPTVEAAGAPYVQASLQNALGNFGPVFIAVSMALFAFTTLIGNYYYCEGCLRFIFKRTPSKTFMTIFRIVAAVIVMLGAMLSMSLAWDTADLFQAMMVVINIPCYPHPGPHLHAGTEGLPGAACPGKGPRVQGCQHWPEGGDRLLEVRKSVLPLCLIG